MCTPERFVYRLLLYTYLRATLSPLALMLTLLLSVIPMLFMLVSQVTKRWAPPLKSQPS